MDLFWTKKTQIQSITNDPLGFNNRLKLNYFDTLFLGLTVLVSRAKYYILYPRFIKSLDAYNCLNYSNLLKLERAYLVAVCKHEEDESDLDHYGILGKNRLKILDSTEKDDFKFIIFENNRSGYNLLKGNLGKIGLIKRDRFNENNELQVILTSLGERIVDNKIIDPNLDKDTLIEDFYNNDCLCNLSNQEKILLMQVFKGDLKVVKQMEGGDNYIFDDSTDKNFNLEDFIGEVDKTKQRSILSKIRYHSLVYILSIFKQEKDDFLSTLIDDCFIEKKEFSKIRQLWRGYFLVCGFQEVCELTLYLIYEILKNKWDGRNDQEILATFEEIQGIVEEKLVLQYKIQYSNFSKIIREKQLIIKSMENDKKNTLKKIPNLIKEYCRILYEAFQKEDQELKKFINNMDEGTTNFTLVKFLTFYNKHKDLAEGQFTYRFFKDFCLPRQKDVIDNRHYRGTEKILLFETENEIIASFSNLETFTPANIFEQDKLTRVLIKIITDLGLISDNKITTDGEMLLEEYNG